MLSLRMPWKLAMAARQLLLPVGAQGQRGVTAAQAVFPVVDQGHGTGGEVAAEVGHRNPLGAPSGDVSGVVDGVRC